MTNPFEDIEREADDEAARHLAMAEEIDKMETDVTEWEQDFIESVLTRLKKEKLPLTPRQIEVLEAMHEKYRL